MTAPVEYTSSAEKCLLVAVRDRLREVFQDTEVQIEFDEMAPATVGNRYMIVLPGGYVPGPRHVSSGTIRDLVFGVDVLIAKRARHVPRDRTRDLYLLNLGSLASDCEAVVAAIDWRYEVMNAANVTILAELGSSEGFEEPLKVAGIDSRPREAPPGLFGAAGQQAAGLMRTVHFHGARRTITLDRS